MKIIEHRRHAKRTKPSPHINAEGVRITRRLGETAGPYDRVVSSPKWRAVETAVALGWAVDETVSILKNIPKSLNAAIPHDSDFATLYTGISRTPEAEKFMAKLRTLFEIELDRIPEGGRLLIVSHGGILEWSALACLPEKAKSLGAPLEKSEAIELHFEHGKCVDLKLLRLPSHAIKSP